MGPDSVSNLEVWQEGVKVVKEIYLLTKNWPREELYGLTSQVRRASVSIPANLAEGVGRGTSKEAARFAQIALGSVYELDTLLHIASEIGYETSKSVADLRGRLSGLSRRIASYIRYKEKP